MNKLNFLFVARVEQIFGDPLNHSGVFFGIRKETKKHDGLGSSSSWTSFTALVKTN